MPPLSLKIHSATLLIALLLLNGCSSSTSTGSSTPAASQLALSASSITFPATLSGQTAASQSVTVTNSGSSAVTIQSITMTGTGGANFTETTTCGSSLAAAASCTISAAFMPTAAASYSAAITITSSASGSPQSIALSGPGTAPVTLQLALSASSITFAVTLPGQTAASQSVTVTNSGNSSVTIQSIALTGANTTNFTETTTCLSTLAPLASCTITAAFKPAVAATSYSAAITVTSNATSSPQTIALSGSTPSTVTRTFYSFPESDNSVTPLYALITGAQKTVDMTMYALEDTTFTNDLVTACKRGVVVRVILDQNDEKSGNTSAYNTLNAQAGCSAVWANKAFEATHQKSFIVDGTTVAIMSLNLQSQYYSTTRDFALVENDVADIAAIQATFNADYAAGTPSSGVAGASDFSTYTPTPGDDLIWSPTTAQAAMVSIIANAKTSLLIENEEMANSASYIISALETACTNGVTVHIAMVDQSSYHTAFAALEAAGCGVHLYPDTSNGFYIHAKAVVADYGLPTQNTYMGSINYSNASMTQNRELGMYISDSNIVTTLNTTMANDYAGGTPY